ncbi:hypothetical protein BCEP4_100049 [Burkholderia cepacia]|nr:hypothetical protein BCEP4_100049 [Burkholderia cepacia]
MCRLILPTISPFRIATQTRSLGLSASDSNFSWISAGVTSYPSWRNSLAIAAQSESRASLISGSGVFNPPHQVSASTASTFRAGPKRPRVASCYRIHPARLTSHLRNGRGKKKSPAEAGLFFSYLEARAGVEPA